MHFYYYYPVHGHIPTALYDTISLKSHHLELPKSQHREDQVPALANIKNQPVVKFDILSGQANAEGYATIKLSHDDLVCSRRHARVVASLSKQKEHVDLKECTSCWNITWCGTPPY